MFYKISFLFIYLYLEYSYKTVSMMVYTVSSSAERGIMCDKILGPDTLNVDMGDFV